MEGRLHDPVGQDMSFRTQIGQEAQNISRILENFKHDSFSVHVQYF